MQGDEAAAKQRLTKALKLAHGRLCSHLLVCQVLLVLAPLQAGHSDMAGAQSMLESALTLSTSAQFLPGQVQSCQALLRLGGRGDNAQVHEQLMRAEAACVAMKHEIK